MRLNACFGRVFFNLVPFLYEFLQYFKMGKKKTIAESLEEGKSRELSEAKNQPRKKREKRTLSEDTNTVASADEKKPRKRNNNKSKITESETETAMHVAEIEESVEKRFPSPKKKHCGGKKRKIARDSSEICCSKPSEIESGPNDDEQSAERAAPNDEDGMKKLKKVTFNEDVKTKVFLKLDHEGKVFKRSKKKKKKVAGAKGKQDERMDVVEGDDKNSVESDCVEGKRSKAAAYLTAWKNDRCAWKFKKLLQHWLLDNMLNETELPQHIFDILIEYMTEMKGASRSYAVDTCKLEINKIANSVTDDVEFAENELPSSYTRARTVLQHLQWNNER